MRVTSHCANHPSREAGQRCRSCGKWLCDRCVHPMQGHIYCGLKCRLEDLGKRGGSRLSSALRSPVPTIWVVLLIALVTLAMGSWIGVLAVRLSEMSGDPDPHSARAPYAVAEIVQDDDDLRIEIRGSPETTVVLIADRIPVRILTLDADGRGSVTDDEVIDSASLEIAVVAGPVEAVKPLSTPTPGDTPARSSTPSLTETTAPSMTPSSDTSLTVTATPIRPSSRAPESAARRPTDAPTRTRLDRHRIDARPVVSPPVLHLVTDSGQTIAVTFDGNASSNGTADLLDLLRKLDLEITLFVTGGFIDRYPTLVRRAVLAGHEVGNHTFSHPHLTTYAQNRRHSLLPKISKAWFHDQLARTEAAFQKATGRPMAPLWRAPYGEENSTLRGWAMELGYLHVRWSSVEGASLDARDWVADEHSRLYQDSRKMMDRLLGFPRLEGGIVLMHLATERSEPPWTELPRFVRELKRREVKPVKVSELLEGSKTWRKWLEHARENHRKNFPK